MKNKFFILVLYNCNLYQSKSYQSIIKSLELESEKAFLFIYDNSPQVQHIDNQDRVWLGLNYIHDPSNSGLGVAYNTGAAYAEKNKYEWIILLDQDTEFSLDYIGEINKSLNDNPTVVLFAPMLKLKSGQSFSPIKYKFKRAFIVNLCAGLYSLNTYSPVNSGIIINVEAFKNVGGYINEIRLDFSDFQFIERLRKSYDKFYLINSIAIQDFSNQEPDINKNVSRFKIYLDCAKQCNRKSILDDFFYFYTVLRHTTALTLKFKNSIFAKLLYANYLKINK